MTGSHFCPSATNPRRKPRPSDQVGSAEVSSGLFPLGSQITHRLLDRRGHHPRPDRRPGDGIVAQFRNVQANRNVAFVVDDIASTNPWTVRGVEIRRQAEALTDVEPPIAGHSCDLIRITPERIRSWGVKNG